MIYKEDYRKAQYLQERLYELEERGKIRLLRIKGPYVEAETVPGVKKRIHLDSFWDHKSCNLCSINPGAAKSIWWVWEKLGIDYENPSTQTSCTGWMYWATGAHSPGALAAAFVRNVHECWKRERNFNIFCITSFATYTEVRHWLGENEGLLEKVSRYMEELGREVVIPEYIVHVSEVFWALRERIKERAKYTLSGIRVAVHYGDHYWKGIMENALGGYRPHILEDFLKSLGAEVVPYSAYYDCCGFGFRHIIMNRTMTRSQVFKKLRSIRDEAKADLIVTNCPGCGNTLDKNQWIQRARKVPEYFSIPVLFPYQVASLLMGADPYQVACVHFNATPVEPLLDKIGIPYDKDFYKQFKEKVEERLEGEKVIDGVDVGGVWSEFLPPRWIEVK